MPHAASPFYQPDQAGNVGTILRLAACLGVPVDIIEPCGFPGRTGRSSGPAWTMPRSPGGPPHGLEGLRGALAGRLVLLTTQGDTRSDDARFEPDDVLLLGSESGGVPAEVHAPRGSARPHPAGRRHPLLNIAVPGASRSPRR